MQLDLCLYLFSVLGCYQAVGYMLVLLTIFGCYHAVGYMLVSVEYLVMFSWQLGMCLYLLNMSCDVIKALKFIHVSLRYYNGNL